MSNPDKIRIAKLEEKILVLEMREHARKELVKNLRTLVQKKDSIFNKIEIPKILDNHEERVATIEGCNEIPR